MTDYLNGTYNPTSPLACSKCNKSVSDCICPDIDERLAELGGPNGSMVFRKDKHCGKHYARCKCPNPFWVFSDNDSPMVLSNMRGR